MSYTLVMNVLNSRPPSIFFSPAEVCLRGELFDHIQSAPATFLLNSLILRFHNLRVQKKKVEANLTT